MSKKLGVFILISSFLLLCQCRRQAQSPFSEQNLPSVIYNVPIAKDTTITTPKGAVIAIAAGSLVADGSHVRLEVKEAYSIADIIAGGLTTMSGRNLLSSGGMIYINPAKGERATLVKAIRISIPTVHRRNGMQLYKGQAKPGGAIEWTQAQLLPPQVIDTPFKRGMELFTNNCSGCHRALVDATGPALAFLDRKRDKEWLYHAVVNLSDLIAHRDPYANCIFTHFNQTQMTSFPNLTTEDIDAIFEYVNSLAEGVNPSILPDFKKSFDSCKTYSDARITAMITKRDLIRTNGKFDSLKMSFPLPTMTIQPVSNMVTPVGMNAVYYQVNIETFGWYNVDLLLKDLPGIVQSKLSVEIKGDVVTNVNTFLVLPSHKVFTEGGPLASGENEYGFYTKDGMIPLPVNVDGYVLATAEYNGKLYFGKIAFTTSAEQRLQLELLPVTKEQMNESVKEIGLSDVRINAVDSKNANQIREIDIKLKDIEKLKPKNCDCNCGVYDTSEDHSNFTPDLTKARNRK
jgi:mono/diheme cytochrome c family protein